MKKAIIVTYKNGSKINIDIPETFYTKKYKNIPEKYLHRIFMRHYRNFTNALNKDQNVINVNKYLKFSNATISAENVLGVDIKVIDDNDTCNTNLSEMKVPGVHDKTYLDISETSLDIILKKLESTNLLENLDMFIKRVNTMMAKNNVEVTIKAGGKKKPTSSTKKPVVSPTSNSLEETFESEPELTTLEDLKQEPASATECKEVSEEIIE